MQYFIDKINSNITLCVQQEDEKITLTRRRIIAFSLEPNCLKCYTEEWPQLVLDLLEGDTVYKNNRKIHG